MSCSTAAAIVPLASLPGMAERTVKVGSAGKIFSLTGWKVGWVVAPPALAGPISKAHQFLTFATAPNLQAAVAYGLGKEAGYFEAMREDFAALARRAGRRGSSEAGFATLPAEGTYFVGVDLPASGIDGGRRRPSASGRCARRAWRRSRSRLSTRRIR